MDKVVAFTKDPSIRSLEDISPAVTKFHADMEATCNETGIQCVRLWWETHNVKEDDGQVVAMKNALTKANAALAVAVVAKTYFIKIPKEDERKDKLKLVAKAKGHIEKSKLGKAPCCVGLCVGHACCVCVCVCVWGCMWAEGLRCVVVVIWEMCVVGGRACLVVQRLSRRTSWRCSTACEMVTTARKMMFQRALFLRRSW